MTEIVSFDCIFALTFTNLILMITTRMNTSIFLKLSTLIITFASLSLSIHSQGLEAYFSHGAYQIPNKEPYVEVYFTFAGRSISWQNDQGFKKSNLEITLALWKDTTLISVSKEILNHKIEDDSLANRKNLTYLQRMEATEGTLRLQVVLDDLNDTIKPIETGALIDVHFPVDSTCISSVMAVENISPTKVPNKLSKSGYDLTPSVFNFFPTNVNKFNFYAEIYPGNKLKKNQSYLLIYYLKNHESNRLLPNYKSFKRMKAADVNILLNSFDISNLASGNFDFVIEARDSLNQLLTTQYYFFHRENGNVKMEVTDVASVNVANSFVEKYTKKDSLALILRSMNPISSDNEKEFVKNIIATGDLYVMQQYLLHFWEQRDLANPESPFRAYMNEVAIAEKNYKTRIQHGFETDRGRVYLQYGPPNTISQNYNEPSAYPYEIWHYYNLKNQRNRRFVFYNSDLASNTFVLLHSDAIGEPNNLQWRYHLRMRDTGYDSIDDTGENQNDWGSRYNEWYNEPR